MSHRCLSLLLSYGRSGSLQSLMMSGSCLLNDGYFFKFENNGCSIFMNDIFYGHFHVVNGRFILNIDVNVCIHNTDAKH